MSHLIAFDLDGTLVNSRLDLSESANELIATYGAGPLEVDAVLGMVGGGAKLLVERTLAAAGLDPATPGALQRFLEIYERRLVVHTRPYDGVPEAILGLAGRAYVAVLTNKPEGLSVKLLAALGLLDGFAEVVGSDSRFPRKPDPSGLRYLMQRAGSGPHTTILVGDSIIDVETCRQAPARICLASYGFGPFPREEDLPDDALVARRSTDLPERLTAFLGGREPGSPPVSP